MRAIVVLAEHFDDSFTEPQVWLEVLVEGRRLQQFTEEQMEALPESFRCYSCQQQVRKQDIGGIDFGQRLCRWCYPWVSEWEVGGIIKFDLWHRLPVRGYGAFSSKLRGELHHYKDYRLREKED